MKPSNAARNKFIDQTLEVWQPRLGRELNRDEARQIVDNVTGFFAVLAEWSRAEQCIPANDTGGRATFDDEGARHDR